MQLLALSISFTLWFGPAGVTNWQLDVSPTVLIEANVYEPKGGIAQAFTPVPHVVFATGPTLVPGWTRYRTPRMQTLINHELMHARQWEHLGPGFALAYVLMPSAFEDYKSHPEPPWVGTDLNCPFLTITNTSVELLPCWRFP